VARVELLPEEVLYMAERGTLQVWNGRDPSNADEYAQGVGAWCDEEFGVKGAIEMSVMELFGRYMGTEGLSWQRYQVSIWSTAKLTFRHTRT
jgi:tRNA-splicing endonuclease subunit Sen54